MNYKCTHCDEQIKDPDSRAGRETCYVSSTGKHKWVELKPEQQGQFDVNHMPSMERIYGD